MLSALVVEDLDQDLRECFWGNLKEASRPTVGTRRLVGLHGLQGGAEFGIGDRAVQLLTLCWCQPCRDSSLSKGNILITTIAINTNIARGLIPNPNARAGTAYLELEHSGFLEVE